MRRGVAVAASCQIDASNRSEGNVVVGQALKNKNKDAELVLWLRNGISM